MSSGPFVINPGDFQQIVFGIVGSTQAGAFRVEEAVAEGGFAVVYRAYHTAFRAPVALKCLKVPSMLSDRQKDEFLEQFRAEAELLFRLSARIPSRAATPRSFRSSRWSGSKVLLSKICSKLVWRREKAHSPWRKSLSCCDPWQRGYNKRTSFPPTMGKSASSIAI